jgi:hypothetical protein
LLWYGLLVVNHLLWGLFPVSCRYLQTKAEPPLESMRLGFYVAAIAAVGLFTTYTVPVELARRCCKKEIGLEEVCVHAAAAHVLCGACISLEALDCPTSTNVAWLHWSHAWPCQPLRTQHRASTLQSYSQLLACCRGPMLAPDQASLSCMHAQEVAAPGKAFSFCEKVTALLVLAISLGVLAFGGILAANYTSANWLQLLYMTSPLLVALLARAVLGIPIAPALWPALVLTLVGSGACAALFRRPPCLSLRLHAHK